MSFPFYPWLNKWFSYNKGTSHNLYKVFKLKMCFIDSCILLLHRFNVFVLCKVEGKYKSFEKQLSDGGLIFNCFVGKQMSASCVHSDRQIFLLTVSFQSEDPHSWLSIFHWYVVYVFVKFLRVNQNFYVKKFKPVRIILL